MLFYLILRLATFLARRLPERWGYALARWLGRIVYRVSPLARAGRDNFRRVLGPDADPKRVSDLTRRAFQHRLLNLYDMLRMSSLPLEEISRRATFEGLEHIDHLLENKRGMLVTSGHVGPMEFMIQSVVVLGYPFIGITEHLQPERLHRFVMGLRTAHGLDLISTQGALLEVYRRLKKGDILLSAVDRDSTGTGMMVEFFGAPAWMPDGYARLAVRANAPVIFGFCHRTDDGAIHNKLFAPLYPDPGLEKEAAVADLVQRTVHLLEEVIRQHPEEWHLSTPVWQIAQQKLAEGARA